MPGLTLDTFITAGRDFEAAQYRILAGLREIRQAFSRTEVYPQLGNIIELYETLRKLQNRSKELRDALPKRLTGIDLAERTATFETAFPDLERTALLDDLIEWAMPHLKEAIEEGRTIYDFVDDRLHIEQVGVVPLYQDEGYLFIPDRRGETFHVLRYDISVITSAEERYRSLRTRYVKSIPLGRVMPSPREIKLRLISEEQGLPNPATFLIDSEIDFPFEPTTYPIARRKMMQYLCAGGTA